MNTQSIDFQPFVEWDNSPFVLFDSRGKILYLNKTAEVLFGYADRNDLYRFTLDNAPRSYGYKTTPMILSFGTMRFYAVTVGYENDEQISIRLYHTPVTRTVSSVDTDKLTPTDINIILEAGIALFQTANSSKLTLLTDQDIPPLRIDQNRFSKLLRKSLDIFKASGSIHIELKLHLGEHMIINGSKKKIVQLSISADRRDSDRDDEIMELTEGSHIIPVFGQYSLMLDIPLIAV
jgi:PAS domain-containing protein